MGKRIADDARKEAVIEAVFVGMSEGKTVADVAREEKVSSGTIRRWLAEDEGTYARYLRARPLLGAHFAEEAVKVARETTNMTSPSDRLLVETLKWAASKCAPLEYGERQTVEHQGEQTLKVRVVEEEAPKPVAAATAMVRLAAGAPMALPPS